MQLGMTAEKLREIGIETLAIVASKAERARFYLQFRPVQYPVGADPDLITHRAYGVPQTVWGAVQLTGQFLVDREGVVRWANIECAQEGLAGIIKFPTEEDLLAAVRILSR